MKKQIEKYRNELLMESLDLFYKETKESIKLRKKLLLARQIDKLQEKR